MSDKPRRTLWTRLPARVPFERHYERAHMGRDCWLESHLNGNLYLTSSILATIEF